MLRGVIFDMDGVLADSEPLHARAWVRTLARHGVRVDEGFFDRWIGIPDLGTAEDLVERFRLDITPQRLSAERRRLYVELVERELRPFPGLAESLAGLHAPKAVATSSGRTDAARTLERLGLGAFFQAVVTIEDVEHGKPDPEIYEKAARRLGLDPGACAALEDSPVGLASARAAGCYVLAVTTTHPAASLGLADEVHPGTVAALAALTASFPRLREAR